MCALSLTPCNDDDDDDKNSSTYSVSDINGIWYSTKEENEYDYMVITEDNKMLFYTYNTSTNSWEKKIFGKILTDNGKFIFDDASYVNEQITMKIEDVTTSTMTIRSTTYLSDEPQDITYTKVEAPAR